MIKAFPLAFVSAAGALFVPAPAMAEGQIGTLERGSYVCELPGDATGRASMVQEELGFTVTSASVYLAPNGKGTYLRRGDVVEMTSGPRAGERYEVVSDRLLRKLEEGQPSRLRCIRQKV